MPAGRFLRPVVALLATAAGLLACGDGSRPAGHGEAGTTAAATPTWASDVAPILHENCVPCHREGYVAPFPLDTYDEAGKRARQLAEVTRSRYMPPWKPSREHGDFRGERGLEEGEIRTIERWAEAGAPLGDPEEIPPPPTFSTGWELGEPDEIVEMPEPFELAPGGSDVFRNFVLPRSGGPDRWVRAVELRVDNPKVLHHAVILNDPHGVGRELDAAEPGVGFEEMVRTGAIAPPEGHFIGWTPGSTAQPLPDGTWWGLGGDADLVLEAHLLPTGKPEELTARIGLYYAAEPPTKRPLVVRLGSEAVDLPAGAAETVVRDRLELPVDVEVTMIYPHAHYLCREAKGWAELPDGSRRWLIWIPRWDFNWQESYELREPLRLPAGTVLHMEYTFDNSAENVFNPNRPPERVVWGPKSSDEMADLWIQATARDPADRQRLLQAVRWHNHGLAVEGQELRIRLRPEDPVERLILAKKLAEWGELEPATRHYRAALELDPASSTAHAGLARALDALGRRDEALAEYREVVRLNPESVPARVDLASALAAGRRLEEAVGTLREALALDPDHLEARLNLGSALTDLGRPEEGLGHLRRVLEKRPEWAEAHYNVGNALLRLDRPEAAEGAFRRALELEPGHPEAHNNLGTVLGTTGRIEEAEAQFRAALAARPDHADAHRNLAAVLAHRGDGDGALRHHMLAVETSGAPAETLLRTGGRILEAGDPLQALAHFLVALRDRPELAEAHLSIALAWHRLGDPARARQAYDRYVRLRPDGRRPEIERLLGIT